MNDIPVGKCSCRTFRPPRFFHHLSSSGLKLSTEALFEAFKRILVTFEKRGISFSSFLSPGSRYWMADVGVEAQWSNLCARTRPA